MRKFVVGLVGLAAAISVLPAIAKEDAARLPGSVTPYVDPQDDSIPNVIPGDQVAIACDAVEQRSADSDVRVVLTISAVPGEAGLGYQKILATDEQLLKDAVRVRIPTVPELVDQTVDLNVYVVSDDGAHHCDGGFVKIT